MSPISSYIKMNSLVRIAGREDVDRFEKVSSIDTSKKPYFKLHWVASGCVTHC